MYIHISMFKIHYGQILNSKIKYKTVQYKFSPFKKKNGELLCNTHTLSAKIFINFIKSQRQISTITALKTTRHTPL